jgi:hypothetical protein
MLRRFRIAISAVMLTASVLLVALWMRSYWRCDLAYISLPHVRNFLLASVNGELRFEVRRSSMVQSTFARSHHSIPAASDPDRGVPKNLSGFRFPIPDLVPIPVVPHWCPVIILGLIAAFTGARPRFRFSLHTLLVATTFLSVILTLLRFAAR